MMAGAAAESRLVRLIPAGAQAAWPRAPGVSAPRASSHPQQARKIGCKDPLQWSGAMKSPGSLRWMGALFIAVLLLLPVVAWLQWALPGDCPCELLYLVGASPLLGIALGLLSAGCSRPARIR